MYKKRLNRAVSSYFCKHYSKKGQVTIFIIIGLVLLIAVGLIIAVQQEVITLTPDEVVPTERSKVETYVTACLSQLGEEALTTVGLQGGYINVPSRFANDPSLHLKLSPMHTVPYWAFANATYIPALETIKAEIDGYIEKNMRTCVFGLEPFQEAYDLIEKSELVSDTEIVDSGVLFNVAWDIEIRDKSGEKIAEINQHTAESKVHLKRVYETASKIVEMEQTSLKMEDLTQDLLALEHPNVPLTGLELSCDRKEWDVSEAKEAIQNLLRVNLKELQVTGTEMIEFPDEFPYYQNHYVWNLGDSFDTKDVSVVFNYENTFPLLFQVSPAQNGKMYSGMMQTNQQDLLSSLCVQNWKFTYDLVYPVLVRIKDETSGYNFNIAFTVHLIHNLPNRQGEVVASLNLPAAFIGDREYCNNAPIPMSVLTWELVDNGQGVNYREPLEEVQVTFTCLRNSCDLGTTGFDFANSGYQAGKIVDLPYCVGAILRGQKENYKDDWTRIVTKNGEKAELSLIPLLNVPASQIQVVKHELGANGLPETDFTTLSGEEVALINLKYEKADANTALTGEPFHSVDLIIAPSLDASVQQNQKLELLAKADFTYDLEIKVFDGETFVGGYRGQWTPDSELLEQTPQLIFHVFSQEAATDEEQFALMSSLAQNSALVPLPELKLS